jgi:hypothetical protein
MASSYEPGSRYRVRAAFPAGFFEGLAPTLIIRPGDRVRLTSQEAERWPTFSLVANARGETGWVPKRYLRPESDQAVVLHAYNTTCLQPSAGETLELEEADLEGGWLWCRDARGANGWFPIELLDPDPL